MEGEVEFLRRELERKDAILLRMAEGLRELEAPVGPRNGPESGPGIRPGVESQGGDAGRETAKTRRSWWQRIFGG